jgi:hypothetical protein
MTADEIREVLELEPWLRWYLEPDDEDVYDARVRFAVAQRIAIRELTSADIPVATRFVRNKLLTTSYASDRDDEVLP